jgi:NAD(P)-dependent dehydrogenase (short-subunit alcohol dehydrogenase family)
VLSAEASRAPATRNFGAAIGKACAGLGARVYRCCPLGDRSRCEDRAALEEGAGEDVAVDQPAIEQALASALEGGRTLDLLAVDAAGLFAEALASGADPQAALRLCMAGAWETTRALLGRVLSDAAGEEPRGERAEKTAAPGGRIVYIAPPAAAGELAGGAQAGLENLVRTLSIEWARYAITVVALVPGELTSASEAAALTAYLGSCAGAYFSGCVFDLRGA